MSTARNQCSIYLHPTIISNPLLISQLQRKTGLIAMIKGSFVLLKGADQ